MTQSDTDHRNAQRAFPPEPFRESGQPETGPGAEPGAPMAPADGTGRPSRPGAATPTRRAARRSTKTASGPRIVCVGDSLTKGKGIAAGENNYPKELSALTGHDVVNLGVGGETSRTIDGRLGSFPYLIMPEGGVIPASGPVAVTLTAHDGEPVAPLLQGGADHINPCRVAGIRGVLKRSADRYFFQRSAAGAAVAIPHPAPLSPSAANRYRGDIIIKWSGQNDGTNEATGLIERMERTISWMVSREKRWLVCGLTSSTLAHRAAMHADMAVAFGRRFVDLQKYLTAAGALREIGLAPSAQDRTDLDRGLVPDSLRADAVHLNANGYRLVARCIATRLEELDWL